MLKSSERILTTHTGSLPRPESLTQLYVDRTQGKPVDQEKLLAESRAAVDRTITQQSGAGIDIGNNGEQPRDSFFLYLRQRLTGFGGHWERPSRADVDRYPEFQKRWNKQWTSEGTVSNMSSVPMAIGEVLYSDKEAINSECRDFAASLEKQPGAYLEAFMSSPSPGIVASAIRNEYYDSLETYMAALGRAVQIEYEPGFPIWLY